jgi:N-acetylglucosamine malate deacetylase 1
MNILAVAAHPDDVEICCGGTLLRYKQAGHRIRIALTTSGNIGSNTAASREEIAAIREREQLAAAEVLGAEVRFLRFDDEGLRDTAESRRAVLNALRWGEPDVILTSPPDDPSTDHGMTGRLVASVLLSLPGKLVPADEPPVIKTPSLFFWDKSLGIDFQPEIYVDISSVMEQKRAALAKHASQVTWMAVYTKDDLSDYAEITSRFRGMQAGFKYAEGFIPHRVLGYMPDLHLLP